MSLKVREGTAWVFDYLILLKLEIRLHLSFIYSRSHIPGTQYVDVLSNAHSTLFPRNIPDATPLQEQLRAAGVNGNSRIVVYDQAGQAGFFIGSRAAWTLKVGRLSNVPNEFRVF